MSTSTIVNLIVLYAGVNFICGVFMIGREYRYTASSFLLWLVSWFFILWGLFTIAGRAR